MTECKISLHIQHEQSQRLYKTSGQPKYGKAFCPGMLGSQSQPLEYVAKHCPRLEVLAYSPHALVVQRCKQHQLDILVEALAKAVVHCRMLQVLAMEAFQQRPWCDCYNKPRARKQRHDVSKKARIREIWTVDRWNEVKPSGVVT